MNGRPELKSEFVKCCLAALSLAGGAAFAATPEETALEAAVRDAWIHYDDAAFAERYAEAERKAPDYVARCEYFKARFNVHRRALDDAKAFPRAEKDIAFGQTLKTMGVEEKKTVHLKDYWNPTNVTAALQKLIDDPEVTTIVIDRMPTPWYVASVKFGEKVTGKRVLVKSGAKILKGDEFLRYRQKKGRGPGSMFEFESCENVIFESDAAKPEDVLVGCYATYAERARLTKEYGQSIFSIGHRRGRRPTRNVVLRNLMAANSEEDGLCIGANWNPAEELYVENVVFDGNFRQGCSPCSYYSLYFKGCRFLNTRGAPPQAGVDVEPWVESQATVNLYFFDCEFGNNAGPALDFATATRDPVLCLVKRCRFLPTPGVQFHITARMTEYAKYDGKPYSNIRFEDCEFDSRGSVFSFEPCPLYDVTVRDCVIRDARTAVQKTLGKGKPALISVALNRGFGKPELSDRLRAKMTFENVRIEGFEDAEPLGITDELGLLNVTDVFRGAVDWNGRKVDLSGVRYLAPDLKEPKTALVPSGKLLKPARVPAADEAMPESNAQLCFNGAWWLRNPWTSYYFWAEKGRRVTFDFEMRYPRYFKRFPTNTVYVTSASGGRVKVGEVTKGTANLAYVAPDTGWHRFTPGPDVDNTETPLSSGISWFVTNVKGALFAWQADTFTDCFAKFFLKDGTKPYTGYFEVPAGGRECRIRVNYGGFTLKDPAGNVVDSVGARDYRGRYVFTIRPSTDKAEIWSFTSPCTPEGGWTRGLRFYAPLNGIWADSPEALPCEYAEHHVPPRKPVAGKVLAVKLDRNALPAAVLKELEAAKAARRAFAEKKEYAGLKAKLEARIAEMRARGMDDDTQHQIDDIMNAVNLHGRVAEMERKASAETPEVFEAAAFCQRYMADLVNDVRPDSPAFPDRLQEELAAFGVAAPEGVFEYTDLDGLRKLTEALVLMKGGNGK